MTNIDNADYLALLANTPAQDKSLLHRLELAAQGISLYVNADKTMCFKQNGVSEINRPVYIIR